MNKTKLGIIGAGNIARKHLSVIEEIDSIEIVGLTSRTKSKAQELCREYSIDFCADDIGSLIKESKPQGLMLLVSAENMFETAKKVLSYGLPLFIEKPPALFVDQVKELVELAKLKKTKVMVGLNRRYYSIFHKGLDIIKQHGPLLGVQIEGHERIWLQDLSPNLNPTVRQQWIFANSIHTIDLLRFFGGEVKSIKSSAYAFKGTIADQMSASIEFASGAIGTYISHWYSPGGWKVVLYGDGVTVEFKPLEKGVWIDKKFDVHEIMADEVDVKHKTGFLKQIEAFVSLINYGELIWPAQDLMGAYKSMLLAAQLCKLA